MARKLPIGIQSFGKIRRDGFAYVDKTAYVFELAQAGAPAFLTVAPPGLLPAGP